MSQEAAMMALICGAQWPNLFEVCIRRSNRNVD